MGDQWNAPERYGMDGVSSEEYLSVIEEKAIEPFLGGDCGTVLEIGPGGGRYSAVLLRRCDRLIAADTSKAMLKLLNKRFEGESRLETMHIDGTGVPKVPDHSVDVVFSFGVFVHLHEWDFYNYLTEMKRVLKPGGKAFIQHANTESELGWEKFLRDLPRTVSKHKPFSTFSVMTPAMMRMFVERAGMEVIDIRNDVQPRDSITLIKAP
jgi:SAM-dependent methyltransferase